MINDILMQHNGKYFDIALENGDLQQDLSFYTAIMSSLFVNKRANSDEITQPQNQSGWWGNLYNQDPTYEIGSKLWILKQTRNTTDILNKGISFIQDGLKWLPDGGYCQSVNVSGKRTSDNIEFSIVIHVTKNQVEKYTIKLWENTNATKLT